MRLKTAILTLLTMAHLPVLLSQIVPSTYHLQTGSRMWLDGTATIGGFTCGTGVVFGSGKVVGDNTLQRTPGSSQAAERRQVQVTIHVKMLDCGNSAMNRDMYSAMKAEEYPTIHYELTATEIVNDSTTMDGLFRMNTRGLLTIAGVTNEVEIPVTIVQRLDKTFEITGSKELSMSDYRITPPTAFFGLIKADDKLVVNFDLFAAPEPIELIRQSVTGSKTE